MKSYHSLALATGLTAALAAMPALAQAPKIGDAPEAKNMRLVGYNDLQARSGYPDDPPSGQPLRRLCRAHGGTPDVPKP
jgi:hypothetical protein